MIERDAVGQVGPDGGPPLADRGIGGTGAPPAQPDTSRTAERGIGGTGIVGILTGFGSVFVDGVEISYDDTALVDIDGTVADASALRAGQLVAIRTAGPPTAPQATTISVRSALAGRIVAVETTSGTLTIGGQSVEVPEGTWGADRFGLGDWVRVSGLPRPDGTILASRLDAAPAGKFLIRGRVTRDGNEARLGNLVLTGPPHTGIKDFVVVTGDYVAGQPHITSVVPDPLCSNPADYFGPSVNQLVVQAYIQVDNGVMTINGVKVSATPVVTAEAHHDGVAIVSLERGPDGSYAATALHYAEYRGRAEQSFRGGSGAGKGDVSRALRPTAHAWQMPDGRADPGRSAAASITAERNALHGSSPMRTSSINASPESLAPTIAQPAEAVLPPTGPQPHEVTSPANAAVTSGAPRTGAAAEVAGNPIAPPVTTQPASPASPPTAPSTPAIGPDLPAIPLPASLPAGESTQPAAVSKAPLISRNVGQSTGTALKPSIPRTGQVPPVASRRGAASGAAATASSAASAPPASLVTSAVSTVTTTTGETPTKPEATTSSVPSTPAATSQGSPPAGTSPTEPSKVDPSTPSGH